MKTLTLMLTLVLAAAVTPASGQTAMVYAVHGIPGTALGAPTTDLPVDVAVGGTCVAALNALNFGEIRGPLPLPAPATYLVEIKPADTLNPCSKATLLSTNVDVAPGINASIVAHLTEPGTPNLAVFVNDVSSTPPGQGRFILHHTAKAPAVDVRVYRGNGKGNSPSVPIPGFANGAQVAAEFQPGVWQATLSVGDSVVFGPAGLQLKPKTAQLVYAIGIFPDSFTVITKTIPAMR